MRGLKHQGGKLQQGSRKDEPMSIDTTMTADVVGLTKVAPVSRRGFMSATAAVAASHRNRLGAIPPPLVPTPWVW